MGGVHYAEDVAAIIFGWVVAGDFVIYEVLNKLKGLVQWPPS